MRSSLRKHMSIIKKYGRRKLHRFMPEICYEVVHLYKFVKYVL